MNRRDFIITGLTTAGLVLAAPRVAVGEEKPKYTHVANMYPWDGIAKDEETLKKTPGSSEWVLIFKPSEWENVYFNDKKIRKLFTNLNSMDSIAKLLLDRDYNNDELSNIGLTENYVVYWIATDDPKFSQLFSKKLNRHFYKAFVKANPADLADVISEYKNS